MTINFLETLEIFIRWGVLELKHFLPMFIIYIALLAIKGKFGVDLIYIMFKKMGLNN